MLYILQRNVSTEMVIRRLLFINSMEGSAWPRAIQWIWAMGHAIWSLGNFWTEILMHRTYHLMHRPTPNPLSPNNGWEIWVSGKFNNHGMWFPVCTQTGAWEQVSVKSCIQRNGALSARRARGAGQGALNNNGNVYLLFSLWLGCIDTQLLAWNTHVLLVNDAEGIP